MGPFPYDAPPPAITPENPMGTDGFAFVEFAHPEPLQLHVLFRLMGFAKVARHRSKAITVYRQTALAQAQPAAERQSLPAAGQQRRRASLYSAATQHLPARRAAG